MSLSPKTEITRSSSESLVIRSKNILAGYEVLGKVASNENLPDLQNWLHWGEGDGAKKLEAFRQVLSGELYQIYAKYGDDRTNPTSSSGMRNKYHTFVPPYIGQYYKEFGKERYQSAMAKGLLDPMVRDLRYEGLLNPGLDPESEVLNLAASTGSTQYLWQYDQSLMMLEKMREISRGSDWKSVKEELNELIKKQDERLKRLQGYESKDILVRMQSGSDLPLLNALFGSVATQITSETGTASWAAASGRDTSRDGMFGHSRTLDINGLPKKLKGQEHVQDAIELAMRKSNGETLSSELIKDQTKAWIEKERAKNPGCRLTLGVTAGGKTGLEWRGRRGRKGGLDEVQGGLQFDDALALRQEYGGKDGLDILIAVDNSQGRLSKGDIEYLKTKKVMIQGTGSKVVEGPMYSADLYIPPEYQKLAIQAVTANPQILEGLTEYVTQSDLRELLGDELVVPLSDLPDIFSVLKWESAIATMEEFEKIDRVELSSKVRDLMTNIERKLKEVSTETQDDRRRLKIINGHTWEVIVNDEIFDYEMNPQFELLMPFRIKVDGKYLKEKALREIHKAMSEPGESGRIINIGQYVAGANVLRIAPGMMTEIGLVNAPVSLNYVNAIGDAVSAKLQEVMESRLQIVPEGEILHGWSEKNRLDWLENKSKEVYLKVQEVSNKSYDSLSKKVDEMVEIYAQVLRDEKVVPVQLISGKNVAALDMLYRAWEKSNRQEHLQVAFVDQPYILIDKDGEKIENPYKMINDDGEPLNELNSVYALICRSLIKYPNTHLKIYGCSEELRSFLSEQGIDPSRYDINGETYPVTDFERDHPEWYKSLYEVDEANASLINERYKGIYTDHLLHDLIENNLGKFVMIARGLGQKKQWGREHTLPISISDDLDFLGIHPLIGFSEDEIRTWIEENDLPRVTNYVDWLKEVQMICGLDLRFKMDTPQWYIDMVSESKI